MEIREDNVELTSVPVVTIDGKPIGECSTYIIERHFMVLLNKIKRLRAELAMLQSVVKRQREQLEGNDDATT